MKEYNEALMEYQEPLIEYQALIEYQGAWMECQEVLKEYQEASIEYQHRRLDGIPRSKYRNTKMFDRKLRRGPSHVRYCCLGLRPRTGTIKPLENT